MIKMTTAKITDATITSMAELCNLSQVGHETFLVISYQIVTFDICRGSRIRTHIDGFGDR